MATLEYGSDLKGFDYMRALGASPTFALKWIGDWTLNYLRSDGTSGEVDGFLTKCKERGATPLVLLYYWGDGNTDRDITEGGREGKTVERWRRLADVLGAAFVRFDVRGLVVVENEFNKSGCTPAVWDPALADIMARLKTKSGGRVKTVSGLGSWASPDVYDRYPKMLAATDVLGTQLMRGLTKDSREKYEASGEFITAWLEKVAARHPSKEQIVFDITLSTYGGTHPLSDTSNPPEWSTEEPLAAQVTDDIKARESRLLAARVLGFVFREPRDNLGRKPSRNYYGNAESYMGWAERSDGSKKTVLFDAMLRLMSSTPTPAPSPSPEPSPSPSEPTMNDISVKTANQYWLELRIDPAPASATIAYNGGTPAALAKTTYGTYGGKVNLAGVTTVEVKATSADGKTESTARFSVSSSYSFTRTFMGSASTAPPAPEPEPTPEPTPEPAPAERTYTEAEMAAVINERDDLRVALRVTTEERDAARAERDVARAKLAQIASIAGGA